MNNIIINPEASAIVVQTERLVALGSDVQMVPSYAYSGIEQARAVVVAIKPNLDDEWSIIPKYSHLLEDIKGSLDDFIEVELLMLEDMEEYHEHERYLKSQPWVAYRYKGSSEEAHVLPLSSFISHSVPSF